MTVFGDLKRPLEERRWSIVQNASAGRFTVLWKK
jgi:hypothetical protein